MMCGSAFPTRISALYEYSAGGLCGKNSAHGGWFNTFPIPFQKSVLVTAWTEESDGCSNGYFSVRGTENLPVKLPGGPELPPTARLVLQKTSFTERQPLEYVNIAEAPAGTTGMVMQATWAVDTEPVGGPYAGGGYIEGCWSF